MASTENKTWRPYNDGKTIGTIGSENGVILWDEEYDGGTRITLELGGTSYYAITCGIYNWMVHTHFLLTIIKEEAQVVFEEMKIELAAIYNAIPDDGDPKMQDKLQPIYQVLKDIVEKFQ